LSPFEVVRRVGVDIPVRAVKVPGAVSEEMRTVTGIQRNLKVSFQARLQVL
jgi:hypothetical protein